MASASSSVGQRDQLEKAATVSLAKGPPGPSRWSGGTATRTSSAASCDELPPLHGDIGVELMV